MSEKKEKQEMDFEQMMEQRIRENFAVDQQEVKDVSNEAAELEFGTAI